MRLFRLSYLTGRSSQPTNEQRHIADNDRRTQERFWLGILIGLHIVLCCVSLVYLANDRIPHLFDAAMFHIRYDPSRLYVAILVAAVFTLFAPLFALARFSFGYFIGFYFYTMVLGYLWIACFSDLNYNHPLAQLSAVASAAAFLLPALFIVSPIRQTYALSERAFDWLLASFFLLGIVTVAISSTYSFQFVGIEHIYEYRNKMESPALLRYLVGITSSTLLPFAFAGFVARRAYWRSAAVIVLLVFFYPITYSKLALFAPCWIVALLILLKWVKARAAVILSLLVPLLTGILLISLFGQHAASYFSLVNFRMIAIPSVAMDVYHDFFATHDLTYFCQMSPLKRVMGCPYQDQLSIVMQNAYKLGYFNASLFATEGIASVGTFYAPFAVFICGLVIALGNRLSADLPPNFILLSGAIIPQIVLNVPLATTLLTHGLGLLFLLWYVTPRTIFELQPREAALVG
ncbi:hypothetical protein ABIC09_004583 [Bradyrhizobium sp. S3.12.5]